MRTPLDRPAPRRYSRHPPPFSRRIPPGGAPMGMVRIEMVDRTADADPGAFFRSHYPDLYRYISASTGLSRADVDDLVQETLVQAWRDRRQFEKTDAPSAWLLAIARNRVRDLLRRRRVRQDADAVLRALGRLEIDEVAPDLLESAELGVRVREALRSLPPEYSDLLVLRYLEEKPVKAIAELNSESEDAVESRLRRAREAFRKRLSEGADHGE